MISTDNQYPTTAKKQGSLQTARSKVIYYSDKSETDSGDEVMGDTPSNYDLANCRFDLKKLPTLKAILTNAKVMGGSLNSPTNSSRNIMTGII
jgi:hypothetical protein